MQAHYGLAQALNIFKALTNGLSMKRERKGTENMARDKTIAANDICNFEARQMWLGVFGS